jgi:hypothetical protein
MAIPILVVVVLGLWKIVKMIWAALSNWPLPERLHPIETTPRLLISKALPNPERPRPQPVEGSTSTDVDDA